MDRNLSGKLPTFARREPRSNPYRLLLLVGLIIGGVWLITQIGEQPDQLVKPLFLPTPTPTRTVDSYLLEAEAYFAAGKIDDPVEMDAIDAYYQAIAIDPTNTQAMAELARLLTYSTSLLASQDDKIARMAEARQVIEQAVALAPDDTTVLAIQALVLNWSASVTVDPNQREEWLILAEQAAGKAYNFDPDNYLALAFYAEVLLDQQKWSQAEQHARTAVELAPDVMDTHRVYGTVLETFGQYRLAIEQYQRAAEINPNLTFLYIRIGVIYRELQLYDQALEYFERAISINNSNGVQDPLPYIAIAKTYSRMGEFFIAGLNAQRALAFDPTNANTYGQLGDIYRRARNYESAQLAFECVVYGCSVTRAQEILDELELGIEVTAPVEQMPLLNDEVAWYYAMYGSVLAALSRPSANQCPEALDVLEQVRLAFPENTLLMGLVAENEAICRLIEATPAP
ncbi:MAG: tetratricopeptide repeat protein [Anaerolineales bacterium]|nr:tetratricopeptide repeat protein [Anaerolineales bacterium]